MLFLNEKWQKELFLGPLFETHREIANDKKKQRGALKLVDVFLSYHYSDFDGLLKLFKIFTVINFGVYCEKQTSLNRVFIYSKAS